jgi:post-segregation antitoxin (ccd killing protein)
MEVETMGNSAGSTDDKGLPEDKGTPEDKGGKAATAAGTSTGAATDFDISKVDVNTLPKELQTMAKSLQADYTKKTTKLAEDSKKLAGNVDWYEENAELIEEFNKYKESGGVKKEKEKELEEEELDPDNFDKKLAKESKDIRERTDDMFNSGFTTVVDLMELQRKHPEFEIDVKKVLAYAQKEGIQNIEKAFEGSYGEERFQKRLDAEVKIKEAELKEKYETKVLTDASPGGRVRLSIIKPKDRDK